MQADLDLTLFQDKSSCHVLGVAPDSAYIHLIIPEELMTLTERNLTAMELHNVLLALSPDPSRFLHLFSNFFATRPARH